MSIATLQTSDVNCFAQFDAINHTWWAHWNGWLRSSWPFVWLLKCITSDWCACDIDRCDCSLLSKAQWSDGRSGKPSQITLINSVCKWLISKEKKFTYRSYRMTNWKASTTLVEVLNRQHLWSAALQIASMVQLWNWMWNVGTNDVWKIVSEHTRHLTKNLKILGGL